MNILCTPFVCVCVCDLLSVFHHRLKIWLIDWFNWSVITYADINRGSRAVSGVCLCVCLHDNSKTNDLKCSNLVYGMTLGYPTSNMILRSKVIRQSQRVTKYKYTLKAIEWLSWVCTLSSAHRLVFFKFLTVLQLATHKFSNAFYWLTDWLIDWLIDIDSLTDIDWLSEEWLYVNQIKSNLFDNTNGLSSCVL